MHTFDVTEFISCFPEILLGEDNKLSLDLDAQLDEIAPLPETSDVKLEQIKCVHYGYVIPSGQYTVIGRYNAKNPGVIHRVGPKNILYHGSLKAKHKAETEFRNGILLYLLLSSWMQFMGLGVSFLTRFIPT